MERVVGPDRLFYAFASDLKPMVTVKQGETVRVCTIDALGGQIRSEADTLGHVDWGHVNPATGPIAVEGALPGGILRVDIRDLQLDDTSVMCAIQGEGALGDLVEHTESLVLPHERGAVRFRNGLRVPMTPMVGVIGVAPAAGCIPTGTPGPHGGNMDCTLVTKGARLYFRVGVPGALLGAGDLHAAMGDGEVLICGAECAGELLLRAEVVPALSALPTPFLENAQGVATIFSAETLDEAANGANHAMARFLIDVVGIRVNDAIALMSLVGNLRVCQVVDPLKTARFEFPAWVLAEYGFRGSRFRSLR